MDFAPWPYFADDEIQATVKVLRSGRVNQWTGDETTSFEKEFAGYVGSKYAVALANGSLALDLSLIALGIGEGDEVIVTPRSFVASVSCVCLRGATPVFVDIDPVTQNITMENISRAVTKKTKAVILVHMAGWVSELDEIQSFCRDEGIALIEDCAQAHGAAYKNKKAGSWGDCSIFSFCQDKIMTTSGEGGMLLTNNKDIWEKVWSYKDHGKKYNKFFPRRNGTGFQWTIESFGTNFRMTEIQAAVGRVVLKKLDEWVEIRRKFAELYTEGFKSIQGMRVTDPPDETYHAYYRYYAFIDPERIKKDCKLNDILNAMNEKGIPCNAGICPEIYVEKAFENYPFKIVDKKKCHYVDLKNGTNIPRLKNAKALGETSLSFLTHPTLKEEQIFFIIDQVKGIMKKVAR